MNTHPANPVAPPRDAAMPADEAARVCTILSPKIANSASAVPEETRGTMQKEAAANLTALVAQAALRVRARVAEAVRALPDGPREIVLRLAQDPEGTIAEPVILCSPMLTSEDLVALIASAPAPGTITAVARRGRIDETVADAVVEAADAEAITALLSNQSARIREATLDALAAQSEEQPSWREPLVRRPRLSARAQRVLADIVTGSLLETLAARPDLDSKVNRKVRAALDTLHATPRSDMRGPAALAHAQALRDAGRLDDAVLLEALRDGALVLATAIFAVRAEVPVSLVEQTFRQRNAPVIVALAWKAGMRMQTAVVVQAALARLPPDLIIRGGPAGTFPLPELEMRRQLDLLHMTETARRRWTPGRLGRAPGQVTSTRT